MTPVATMLSGLSWQMIRIEPHAFRFLAYGIDRDD
jgi:hypothetical protein